MGLPMQETPASRPGLIVGLAEAILHVFAGSPKYLVERFRGLLLRHGAEGLVCLLRQGKVAGIVHFSIIFQNEQDQPGQVSRQIPAQTPPITILWEDGYPPRLTRFGGEKGCCWRENVII